MLLVRKLFEKSQVVFVEHPDIADLMPQDRDSFDTESPREAGYLFCVVSDRFKDGGVHHSAATELDPAGLLAHLAPGAVALPAADVDLRAGFRVRKEARTEAHARVGRKHLAHERQERSLEVRHGNILTHDQRLELTEGGRVREIEIVEAVH